MARRRSVFCDGRFVGGTLDRNGLRPSRYVVTKDGLIVMASEVGVQTFAPEDRYKGPPTPGKLLLVDTEEGRIIQERKSKNGQPAETLPRVGRDVPCPHGRYSSPRPGTGADDRSAAQNWSTFEL